jgi:hypothetical protein
MILSIVGIPKFSEHAMSKVASVTIEDRLKMEELIAKNNDEISEIQEKQENDK